MKKYLLLFICLISSRGISCEDTKLPSKLEWTRHNDSMELFLSVPEYFDGSGYYGATLRADKIKVMLDFTKVDYIGWLSTTIQGDEKLFQVATVTVYYKSLGKYDQASNSFSFPGCLKEFDIQLKM